MRIKSLQESPCNQCGCSRKCSKKIRSNHRLSEIKDAVFGKADFDFHDCGIWIALNAKEMVEVNEW